MGGLGNDAQLPAEPSTSPSASLSIQEDERSSPAVFVMVRGGGDILRSVSSGLRSCIRRVQHCRKRMMRMDVTLLSVFSLLIFFLPSEPFLVPFLEDTKKLSEDEVLYNVFPLWTYAEFVFLVLLVGSAEAVGMVPLLVGGLLAEAATLCILIWAKSLLWLQVEQVSNAFFSSACQLLFFAYVYYCVPEERYPVVASVVRFTCLLGTVVSSVLGQLLVSVWHAPLVLLFYLSLGSVVAALGWAFLLREPRAMVFSVFSHFAAAHPGGLGGADGEGTDGAARSSRSSTSNTKSAVRGLVRSFVAFVVDFVRTYRSIDVLHFSLWMWVACAVHRLVLTYWQNVFREADPTVNYNGYIYTAAYIPAAAGAFASHRFGRQMSHWGDCLLVASSVLCGFLLLAMSRLSSLAWLAVAYVAYHSVFESVFPVAASQLAIRMSTTRFAPTFLANDVISLAFQSVVQFVVGRQGLKLSVSDLFLVLGTILFVLTFALVVTGLSRVYWEIHSLRRARDLELKPLASLNTHGTSYRSTETVDESAGSY